MVVVPLSLILRETPHVPRGTTIRHFVNTAPPNSIPHRIRITTLFQSGTFVHHVSTTASPPPHAPHHARGPFPEIEGSHAAKKFAAIPITGRGNMDHLTTSIDASSNGHPVTAEAAAALLELCAAVVEQCAKAVEEIPVSLSLYESVAVAKAVAEADLLISSVAPPMKSAASLTLLSHRQ
jgi:hypothetical protein